ALARLIGAVAALAFRPLMVVAALFGAPRPVSGLPGRPADRPRPSRTRLLVHSVGRRGPPRSGFAVA
ncbi:hypothetical protein AB0E14_33885, partial [Streptomyces sp. NPDC047981]